MAKQAWVRSTIHGYIDTETKLDAGPTSLGKEGKFGEGEWWTSPRWWWTGGWKREAKGGGSLQAHKLFQDALDAPVDATSRLARDSKGRPTETCTA